MRALLFASATATTSGGRRLLRSSRAARSRVSGFVLWHGCDLRAAPINVRSWESNGLNADVASGPFMTHLRHQRAIFAMIAQRRSGATVWYKPENGPP